MIDSKISRSLCFSMWLFINQMTKKKGIKISISFFEFYSGFFWNLQGLGRWFFLLSRSKKCLYNLTFQPFKQSKEYFFRSKIVLTLPKITLKSEISVLLFNLKKYILLFTLFSACIAYLQQIRFHFRHRKKVRVFKV